MHSMKIDISQKKKEDRRISRKERTSQEKYLDRRNNNNSTWNIKSPRCICFHPKNHTRGFV